MNDNYNDDDDGAQDKNKNNNNKENDEEEEEEYGEEEFYNDEEELEKMSVFSRTSKEEREKAIQKKQKIKEFYQKWKQNSTPKKKPRQFQTNHQRRDDINPNSSSSMIQREGRDYNYQQQHQTTLINTKKVEIKQQVLDPIIIKEHLGQMFNQLISRFENVIYQIWTGITLGSSSTGVVDRLSKLFETILHQPFQFTVTSNCVISFFNDNPIFNIDTETSFPPEEGPTWVRHYLRPIMHRLYWSNFFETREKMLTILNIPILYKHFKYNLLLEQYINRQEIVNKMIAKALFRAACIQDTGRLVWTETLSVLKIIVQDMLLKLLTPNATSGTVVNNQKQSDLKLFLTKLHEFLIQRGLYSKFCLLASDHTII